MAQISSFSGIGDYVEYTHRRYIESNIIERYDRELALLYYSYFAGPNIRPLDPDIDGPPEPEPIDYTKAEIHRDGPIRVSFVRDGEKINRVSDGVTTNMEYKINDKIQLNRTLKEFCGIPVTYTDDSMYVGKIRFLKADFKSADYLVKDKSGIYITNNIDSIENKPYTNMGKSLYNTWAENNRLI